MNNKVRVEGIYPEVQEALGAVDRLRNQGYARDNITIVANEEVRGNLSSNVYAEVETQDDDMTRSSDEDQSFWESVKDAFSTDDSYDDSNNDDPNYDRENDPVYEHRDAIRDGSVAVLVMGEPTVEDDMANTATNPDTVDPSVVNRDPVNPDPAINPAEVDPDRTKDNTRNDDDEESIELKEERLEIDKEKEKTGEVHVGKRVVEDTETVEVPVEREEVTIERKPATDKKTRDGNIDDTEDEDIVIPVEEEKAKPKKETDVVEEVEVKKETKLDSETVGDTVRREELEVDEEGNALDNRDKGVDTPDDDKLDEEISNDRFGDDDRRNNR